MATIPLWMGCRNFLLVLPLHLDSVCSRAARRYGPVGRLGIVPAFLLPGFPKDYLCYVLGLSRMELGTFLIISTLGRMPGTYLLTLQGASIRSHEYSMAVIAAVICVVVIFFRYVYRVSLFNWIRGTKESEFHK